MDTTVFSNSKIISIKRDIQREKIRLLTIEDIRNIDFARPWNIQFSENKLTEEEAAEVMQDFKRADGQYFLKGLSIGLFKLHEYVCKNFIKISVRIMYAPTIVAPVIAGEVDAGQFIKIEPPEDRALKEAIHRGNVRDRALWNTVHSYEQYLNAIRQAEKELVEEKCNG